MAGRSSAAGAPPHEVGGLDAHRRVDGEPAVVWPRVHRERGIALEPTAAHEAAQQAAAHPRLHRSDGRPVDPGGWEEDDTPGGRGREHPIEHHAMKMQMRIERRAEAVDEGHRAEARSRTRTRTVRAQARLGQMRRGLDLELLLCQIETLLRHFNWRIIEFAPKQS